MGQVQLRLATAGLSKQTAKGAPAASATYGFGLLDGAVVTADLTQDPEEITLDVLTDPGVNRTAFDPGQGYTARGYPNVSGLWLLGALGTLVTTGASAPFTHTFTPGTSLDYFTLWGRQAGDYFRMDDARLDELRLSFEGAGPIEVEAVWKALGLTWLAGVFTVDAEEVDTGGKFRAAGGTFKLMTGADALAAAPVRSGEIEIVNNIDQVHLADTIAPSEVAVARKELRLTTTVVPEDLLLWRRILTGSTAGTTVSQTEVYGSFEYLFAGPDANTDLKIEAPRVAFTGDFPDVDPAGGALELEFEGVCTNPASGDPITATLRNATASY